MSGDRSRASNEPAIRSTCSQPSGIANHNRDNNNNKRVITAHPKRPRQEPTDIKQGTDECTTKSGSHTCPLQDDESNIMMDDDFVSHNEINDSCLGQLWRAVLQSILLWSLDDTNALRLTRPLQLFLPFLTGHEAYLMSQVIQAMDNYPHNNNSNNSNNNNAAKRKRDNHYELEMALRQAFGNRNVSRILVQTMRVRFDFLWHWSTMVTWNRVFDGWGQLPLVGITSFPATENFPSTRNHALASMFRLFLGPGNWLTRVVTQGREALVTDNHPEATTAQNLAAESNGFEAANRNQFGTYFGRRKLNEFRLAHRLPTDESIVRTFVAQPMSTLVNNGVVHVLRQLAKHWHNILHQECGNFSHQRMEQLDPFETLRFHIPEVLLALSSLRGRNKWDSKVLGPMIQRLQGLKPGSNANEARSMLRELKTTVVSSVCAGVPSVANPFHSWLDAILVACDKIDAEAAKVYKLVLSVDKGIHLGYTLFTQVSWKVPSHVDLEQLILDHIHGKPLPPNTKLRIRSALQQTTPRDMRTLIELVKNNLTDTRPAKLLLARVKTLLQRELRRERLNRCLRQMSTGKTVSHVPVHGEWYWLVEESGGKQDVYAYDELGSKGNTRRFVHVNSGKERLVSHPSKTVVLKSYIAVAEAISRAQKQFMTIELEYGHKFTYSAFMEFSHLRSLLQRLIVVSQISCEELDNARLNILKEVQQSRPHLASFHDLVPGSTYYRFDSSTQTYEPFVQQNDSNSKESSASTAPMPIVHVPPQNVIVIGGGPSGLMATIHCAENVLLSGGTIRLLEARDSFVKGGSSFERAQIVRLDARWIATLRYHLGTGFEDVFIPASGETDSQLGNSLPTQGFVEITIKDLESLLHTEVSRLWSKGLISMSADSKASFDSETNRLTKLGMYLKVNDCIERQVDADGKECRRSFTWKVVDLVYSQPLRLNDLQTGTEYGVYVRQKGAVLPFKLIKVCLHSRTYTFVSLTGEVANLEINAKNLPSIYAKDINHHADVHALLVECTKKGRDGSHTRQELLMRAVEQEKFILDVGNCHVVEAIGKPNDSNVHLRVTTPEPYGVLCMQGLKVSMGMHNFGGKRWGSGLLDDIRSQNDQNTRIIGDFTKMVRVPPIMASMHEKVANDENWRTHFETLLIQSPTMKQKNRIPALLDMIERACERQATTATECRRQTLQTRFFETGDNFYLGMEFPREYEHWKRELVENIASVVMDTTKEPSGENLKNTLMHHLDRLWFESCLETIRTGDVYNPGARHRVPHLFLVKSYKEVDLGSLPMGESFRISNNPEERYEILVKKSTQVVVRNAQGLVASLLPTTKVKRESNLTRTPDGNGESNVALATFPVSHYVNYRTLRLNDSHSGFVYTFIGDEQATPHFMRYSGLTGACINAMLLDNFIKQAIEGVPFANRFASYSRRTNWSSGEVVQRGSGACFGEDGFLRPGFSYSDFVDYLCARVTEHRESKQDLSRILTHDWTVKIASSLIPRGMELNTNYLMALKLHLRYAIFNRVFGEVDESWKVGRETLDWSLQQAKTNDTTTDSMDWDSVLDGIDASKDTKAQFMKLHLPMAKNLEETCNHVIRYASKAYLYNERISSELYNQPKSVDSILDDFAVEAQNFANSFVLAAALSSATLAFRLVGSDAFNVLSTIVSVLSIAISFDTMANIARYKIRNEEARLLFYDNKLVKIKQAITSLLPTENRRSLPDGFDPFVVEIGDLVARFQESATYYGHEESDDLNIAFERFKTKADERKEIKRFQRLLTSKLIVDSYHVNSYLQEDLVAIYKALNNSLSHCPKHSIIGNDGTNVQNVLNELHLFSKRLDASLQRGPIRWGFIKKRKLAHWDLMVILRYFYSLLCSVLCRKACTFVPIETATHSILDSVTSLSANDLSSKSKTTGKGATPIRREIRDLEELYWATHESDIASMIFVSAFLVFGSSIVFTTARIFSISVLEQTAFWALVPSTLGAALAIQHLVRKLRILWNLWWILRKKAKALIPLTDRANIRQVCHVTMTQILLTCLRLSAAMAAAVALPFSIAENGFGDQIGTPPMIPFWVALGAVCAAVLATWFFFVVEYVVRYSLSPKLPASLVESFRDELNALYWEFHKPWNDVETKQVQERITWEYVAREFLHIYRLDTVFAADRVGAILQKIQSGMEAETNPHKAEASLFSSPSKDAYEDE